MERKLKVRLLGYVERFGKPGDVVEVGTTFANNFLFPKKLAKAVSESELADMAAREKRKAAQAGEAVEKRHEIREKLHGKRLKFELAGKAGHAFGGVSAEDIAKRVAREFGVHVDKSQVRMTAGHHLKAAGTHEVHVHLHADTFIRMEAEVKITEAK